MGAYCCRYVKNILLASHGDRSATRTDHDTISTRKNQGNMEMKSSMKARQEPNSLTISDRMSAPTVITYSNEEDGKLRVSGFGMALVDMPIEQDAAYWEWHIEKDTGKTTKESRAMMGKENSEEMCHSVLAETNNHLAIKFGVATRKDASFYHAQESSADEDVTPIEDGTALMRPIEVLAGDTVGVAVQQSDLPMIQFLLNGELLSDIAVNKFRGTVYPSLYIRDGYTVIGIFRENEFKELSPHARFGPLIAARGII